MQNFVLQRFATFFIKKINKIFFVRKKNLSLQRTQNITIIARLNQIPQNIRGVPCGCSNAPRLPFDSGKCTKGNTANFFMYNFKNYQKWKN